MPADAQSERIRRHLVVLRCQAGDERAFRTLYDEFGGRSLRYLAGLVGDDAAQDIQQETWLAVYRRIASLADPARFATWLLATARNRAIDWLRKRKRERDLLDESAAELREPTEPEPEPRGPSFDDAVVHNAMAGLPATHREVLLLRYRYELNYAEIALVTSCPVGTVRSRLHHARLQLERLLGPEQTTNTRTNRRQK